MQRECVWVIREHIRIQQCSHSHPWSCEALICWLGSFTGEPLLCLQPIPRADVQYPCSHWVCYVATQLDTTFPSLPSAKCDHITEFWFMRREWKVCAQFSSHAFKKTLLVCSFFWEWIWFKRQLWPVNKGYPRGYRSKKIEETLLPTQPK